MPPDASAEGSGVPPSRASAFRGCLSPDDGMLFRRQYRLMQQVTDELLVKRFVTMRRLGVAWRWRFADFTASVFTRISCSVKGGNAGSKVAKVDGQFKGAQRQPGVC